MICCSCWKQEIGWIPKENLFSHPGEDLEGAEQFWTQCSFILLLKVVITWEKKISYKKDFASNFSDFPVFPYDFRTLNFRGVLIFPGLFYPVRDLVGRKGLAKKTPGCVLVAHAKSFTVPAWHFWGTTTEPQFLSLSSHWPVPGPMWGMFLSLGVVSTFHSLGTSQMSLCLDAEEAL